MEAGIVEFYDYPGISTKEFENDFMKIVEHKNILGCDSLYAIEFKFETFQ